MDSQTNNDQQQSSTLVLDNDIADLPEDEPTNQDPVHQVRSLVTLISLNANAQDVDLVLKKTIFGRDEEQCSPGAVLSGSNFSRTHFEVSSRSFTDVDAVIWVRDFSSNGIWVNEKRIPKDQPFKIFNKDIISFCSGSTINHRSLPSFMLVDKRNHPTLKEQQNEHAKRVAEALDPVSEPSLQEQSNKKRKTNSDADLDHSNVGDGIVLDIAEVKQKDPGTDSSAASAVSAMIEESAFEKEFECGICHDIMYKALVLQPCLHAFCKECCKGWFSSNADCPSCRQRVTKTKRDFKLNNLITLFLKNRPHMAREDVEEDAGADSDTSDVVRRRRRRNGEYDDEYDDGDDDDDDDDDDGDNGFGFAANNNFLDNPYVGPRLPSTCPCCDPANTTGYVCPPEIRLEPLAADVTVREYHESRLHKPGHGQCQCGRHIPEIAPPGYETAKDLFRCKMCHFASCGCNISSVEDHIENREFFDWVFNQREHWIVQSYLQGKNQTYSDMWEEVKQGMDSGIFYFLGTREAPGRAIREAAAVPSSSSDPLTGSRTEASSPSDDIPVAASSSSLTSVSTSVSRSSQSAISMHQTPSTQPQDEEERAAAPVPVPAPALIPAPAPIPAPAAGVAQLAGLPVAPLLGLPPYPMVGRYHFLPRLRPWIDGPLPAVEAQREARAERAATLTSSDKLCTSCRAEFHTNGPLYQWRVSLDPTSLVAIVPNRADCWWGRECRTQFNNAAHAARLNHICDKTR
ncbi:hypothetical protein BGW38_005967 [Lunasporangiospora selenospora]|uniref:RING-type E3 ubiquitin transferase n=1 Tax=Lunasporangiospora selenospora TaxID=979761 RepID=A0A9P6G2M6_9FUNG|nr:hypothetical protein BGW38_005967 [Lunasporangiospora selenospora]